MSHMINLTSSFLNTPGLTVHTTKWHFQKALFSLIKMLSQCGRKAKTETKRCVFKLAQTS